MTTQRGANDDECQLKLGAYVVTSLCVFFSDIKAGIVVRLQSFYAKIGRGLHP